MNCNECKAELPKGAHFCIECAAPVAVTGRTERLGVAGIELPYVGTAVIVEVPYWLASNRVMYYGGTAEPYQVLEVRQDGGSAVPTYFLRGAK